MMWEPAYENGDPYIGEVVDVEARVGWKGDLGALCASLVGAGGKGHAGFIEEGGSQWWLDGEPGTYRVHDLYDHAPDYVTKRMKREAERVAKGQTISEMRASAGRRGAASTNAKKSSIGRQTSGQLPDAGWSPTDRQPANDRQFDATPAPAPAREVKTLSAEEAQPQQGAPANALGNAALVLVKSVGLGYAKEPEPVAMADRGKPTHRAQTVYEYWCRVMDKGPRTVFDAGRRSAIEKQLKAGRTVEELCQAVDGCKRDRFSMGENDYGKKFNDISLICRDAAHVEKFVELAESPQFSALRTPTSAGAQRAAETAKNRQIATQHLLGGLNGTKALAARPSGDAADD
jgi:hypothetical protein